MKQKLTLLLSFWLLVFSQQVMGNTGSPSSFGKESSSFMPAPPAAGFTYVATSGCIPVTVQFYSQINGPIYNWAFGDGGTSSDCNPVHTYTTPGVYVVTLTATGGTYSTTITVGANPVVTFTGDTIGCQNDSKMYTATSTIPAASYSWSAQGGSVTSSTATTATVNWSSYGVNYLTYTITTAAGCTKVFRYKVKVIPPPTINLPCCDKKRGTAPQGDLKAIQPPRGEEGSPGGSEPCSACAGSYNCYTASVDAEFGLSSDYTWQWTVTNGTIVSISPDSTTACVVWGASGMGTIKLVATHKIYGCQTIKECEVTITPGVIPSFTVSGNCANTPVSFDASGTTPISDVDSYFWEYGDGYTSTTSIPFSTHQFDFVGTYTATLTITTKAGCQYKTTQTFNIINGSKPKIECPGTVCEGSRQCYTTASIPGATYNWTITGDIVADRVITGNKVCVTWGAGPVGTVSVTVIGGGYTCTNTATEAVSIVSSVIPIDAPMSICSNLNYLEVSTANYAGACYKWTINGVSQSSTINTLAFNPAAFASPITVKVFVDFPIGCCHGEGSKVITKLPQYTMFLSPSNSNVCLGSVATYFLSLPAGIPAPPVSWSVDGGVIQSFTTNSVTIKWTTAGTGTITAGNNSPMQYCNDGSNNTWNVKVWEPATGDDISGPSVVCGGSTNTYYHGWEYPTASSSVSILPAGPIVTPGTYSSSIQFPLVATATTYVIKVTYNHAVAAACSGFKYDTVTVIPKNIPVFSIPPGNVCEGDTITYTATVPDTLNYDWNVVGGSIISETYVGTTLTIKVQWNSTVTSKLTMLNKVCGTDTAQAITVNGKPVVIISATEPTCSNPTVTLRVAPVWATYAWSGGGSTNTKTVSTPGVYSVTIGNGVCFNSGSINVPVTVPVPPDVTGFNVSTPISLSCPKYRTICPIITPGSGTITNYSWTFTGFTISSSTATCPAVALSAIPGPSTGTWKLVVTNSYGCKDSLTGSLTDSCIDSTGPGTGCTSVATFSATYNPCTGQFTSTGTNYTAVTWYFGDGNFGSGFNPIHFYSTACSKTVTAYVTDNGTPRCVRPFTFTINVPYTFGIPEITTLNSACNGATSITATGVNICPGSGLSATYAWTITPTSGGAPVYTVTTLSNTLNVGSIAAIPDGDYTATVVMTIAGCSKTVSGTFNKGGLTAYFVSCGGCAGSPLTFIDQSIPYGGNPLIKWEWSFVRVGGGASFSSFLQNPTVNFTVAGTYTATLIVTDNAPCKDTFVTSFVIQPPFNPGNILVNGVSTPSNTSFDICPGAPFTLKAPSGASYSWSNGSNDSTIVITEPGIYYVTVFNANNCAAKIGPITINYKPAPESIILSSPPPCSPLLLRAFAGTGYSYLWNYPVSSTSTQPNVSVFSSGLVTLKVTNLYGCSATTSQNFTINPTPFVTISAAPTPFCPGNTATLTANVFGGTGPFTYLWNEGSTSASIPVSSPGLYKVSVLDGNNCPAKTQLDLQPELPSGMDLLPRGCYDVCGQSVTFCAGTMPFGWTGQWYKGASTFGSPISGGSPINTTFVGSGTYTLHYIPVNPATACSAVSAPITINFITLPTFTINHNGPTVICANSGIGVELSANIQSPIYNYTWYLGGSVVGSGYTYTALTAGVYTLVVSKGACCSTSVSITITEENCCFENPNVPYTPILSDLVISSNTFWFNKYYIDATVTVVGNAILDITNVDCVFGPSGKIVFKEESFLRCNNSVLRPCGKDDVWQGLDFYDRSSGWINTTTIKNAIIGVEIEGNRSGVRLTDNSFIKCQIGVSILKSDEQQSISGNTFEIDESQLRYPGNPNEYWGIKMYDVRMKGLIAQNQFRHVQPQGSSNYYLGIYLEYANATISENQFNDMHRSIDVTRNRDVVAIEKNEMKINTLKEVYDKYQIRATDCELPVLIYQNNMDNGLGRSSWASAIYCQKTYRTHIKDNKLNGFLNGIFARYTSETNMNSNTITNSISVGITMESTDRNVVSCNNINAMKTDGINRMGILEVDGNGSAFVYSNCIFNMNNAMYFQSAGYGSYNLPMIYNNYLYNYDENGLYNFGYTGALGNVGGATDAGRNTFMSNNGAIGTLDINSNPVISEDGNFGVLFTSGTFTSSPQDIFYSTAACGQQIQGTYPKNQLDRYNTCDIYYLDRWVYKTANGLYALRDLQEKITPVTINEAVDAKKDEIIGQASAQMTKNSSSALEVGQALLDSKMDRNLVARIVTTNCLSVNAPQLASNFLSSPQLAGINSDLRTVLGITIELAINPKLTAQQFSTLSAIDNLENEYSPIARDLIHGKTGGHDYKFPTLEKPQVDSDKTNVVSKLGNSLSVYPVPASQNISVKHHVKDANVQGLKVLSVTGIEITNYKYTVQSGIVTIDVSALADGVYHVILLTDSKTEPTMQGRFIKMR